MDTLDVRLKPIQLLGAWRAHTSHLILTTRASPRLHDSLAARIRLEGCGLGATVVGSVGSILDGGTARRIEFVPNAAGLAAVRFLIAAAEGRDVPYQERPTRLLARLPAVLRSAARQIYMDTHSISRRGCRLHWSGGAAPQQGEELALRLGAGPRAVRLEGVVRWVTTEAVRVAVGVAFVGGECQEAWQRWLELIQQGGAPLL